MIWKVYLDGVLLCVVRCLSHVQALALAKSEALRQGFDSDRFGFVEMYHSQGYPSGVPVLDSPEMERTIDAFARTYKPMTDEQRDAFQRLYAEYSAKMLAGRPEKAST